MGRISWTREAETWLEDIYRYIARDNPVAAHRVIKGIHTKAELIRDFPGIGHVYRELPEGEVRVLLYGHYRIAYLLKSDESAEILGVFHGALDIDRYI